MNYLISSSLETLLLYYTILYNGGFTLSLTNRLVYYYFRLVMGWLRFSEADRIFNCINHPDTVRGKQHLCLMFNRN